MRKLVSLLSIFLTASFAAGADGWQLLGGQTSAAHVPDAFTRIYNGVPTSDFPAVAGIAILNVNGSVAGCSGTLVSPSVVLTAAHCVTSGPVAIRTVFFPGGVEADYDVAAYAVHPEFSPTRLADADIALLLLGTPVAGVEPVPLATRSPRAGKKATIVGYGRDETGTFGLKQFGSVKLRKCPRRFNPAGLTAGQLARSLCWRPRRRGQDTCHGDSGGPLLVNFVLVGVTSGGFPDCPGLLSWDTDVVPFLSWIGDHLV
jgi:secreted trypsin-like serine protease